MQSIRIDRLIKFSKAETAVVKNKAKNPQPPEDNTNVVAGTA
jgi:hypothetical protein